MIFARTDPEVPLKRYLIFVNEKRKHHEDEDRATIKDEFSGLCGVKGLQGVGRKSFSAIGSRLAK